MDDIVNETGRHHTNPRYRWNNSFTLQELKNGVTNIHMDLLAATKDGVYENLNIDGRIRGWQGYFTRKIRDQVCGRDLKTVMAKQLTVPITLPSPLEDFLRSLGEHHPDLPAHYLSQPFLIPVHNREAWQANQLNPNLPSLHERYSEAGNLRFWIITNESMWSRQHYIIDEVAEILRTLQYLTVEFPVDDPDSVWKTSCMIRRRAMRPDISTAQFYERINTTEKKLRQTTSGLPVREVMLFRSWVFAVPILDQWKLALDEEDEEDFVSGLEFEEDGILYPVPEELYWIDNGMGSWQINTPRSGVWGDP